MTERVMNTNAFPEILFDLITTEKVKVNQVGEMVQLMPVKDGASREVSPPRRPVSEFVGLLEGKVWMSDDFDEPLEEMREYME